MSASPGRAAGPSSGIAYHDTIAASWTDRYARGGFKRRAEFFVDDVLPKTAVKGEWIDVGCGSGFFSRILAAKGARVLGLDGSAGMIESARATAPAAGTVEPPRYDVKPIEALGTVEGAFDGAICLSVIEYLDDPAAALAAIAKLTRRGAPFIVSAPNRQSSLRRAQRFLRAAAASVGSKAFPYMESSRNLWSREELEVLLTKAGFEVQATMGFDPVAPRPLWSLVSPSLWFVIARRA